MLMFPYGHLYNGYANQLLPATMHHTDSSEFSNHNNSIYNRLGNNTTPVAVIGKYMPFWVTMTRVKFSRPKWEETPKFVGTHIKQKCLVRQKLRKIDKASKGNKQETRDTHSKYTNANVRIKTCVMAYALLPSKRWSPCSSESNSSSNSLSWSTYKLAWQVHMVWHLTSEMGRLIRICYWYH